MEILIKKSDALEAVQRCCPDTAMYRAIRDIPPVERGMTVFCKGCDCDEQINEMAHEYMELEVEYHKLKEAAEPRRGEWKRMKNCHAFDVEGVETWGVKYKCSECGFVHTFIEDHMCYGWCPNCGAKMDGEAKE